MPNDCVRCRRLVDNTFCTSDVAVMETDGAMACHEVKSHWQGDVRAKIKTAAAMCPFRFIAVKAKPRRDCGGWAVEEF